MKKIASTIRWDSEAKKQKVESIAQRHTASVNKLVNDWAEIVIAQEAAEASFRAAAARGNPEAIIALLKKLNADDEKAGIRNTHP